MATSHRLPDPDPIEEQIHEDLCDPSFRAELERWAEEVQRDEVVERPHEEARRIAGLPAASR